MNRDVPGYYGLTLAILHVFRLCLAIRIRTATYSKDASITLYSVASDLLTYIYSPICSFDYGHVTSEIDCIITQSMGFTVVIARCDSSDILA